MGIDHVTLLEMHLDITEPAAGESPFASTPSARGADPESTGDRESDGQHRWLIPAIVLVSIVVSIAVAAMARSLGSTADEDVPRK